MKYLINNLLCSMAIISPIYAMQQPVNDNKKLQQELIELTSNYQQLQDAYHQSHQQKMELLAICNNYRSTAQLLDQELTKLEKRSNVLEATLNPAGKQETGYDNNEDSILNNITYGAKRPEDELIDKQNKECIIL